MAKRRDRHNPSSLERLNTSRDAKKEQLDKSTNEKKKRKIRKPKNLSGTKPKSKQKQASDPKPETLKKFRREAEFHSQVAVHHSLLFEQSLNHQLKMVIASRPYTELAATLLQLSQKGGALLSLSWPKGLEWPGLAHALANRVVSAVGREVGGINMLLYPATRTNSNRYRRSHIPGRELLELARRAFDSNQDLPARYHAYLTLNALEHAGIEERRRNPSLFTITPLLEYSSNDEDWKRLGGASLRDLGAGLWGSGQYSRIEKIEEYRSEMDDPSRTTEANFRVPRTVHPREVSNLIRKIKVLNVVVIDARSNLVVGIPGWNKWIPRIVSNACTLEDHPAVVVLVDDPESYKRMESDVLREFNSLKMERKHPLQYSRSLRVDTSPWKHEQKRLPKQVGHGVFTISVLGALSLQGISKLNKLAQDVEADGESQLAAELRKLGGFLRSITDTPVGQGQISRWVKDVTSDWSANVASRFSANFYWSEHKIRLLARLSELNLENHPVLSEALSVADDVASGARITEVEAEVIRIVEEAFETKKSITVVVPTVRHIVPLSERLKALPMYGIELLSVVSQKCRLEELKTTNLIIAGGAEKFISKLLINEGQLGTTHLIVNGYGALRLDRKLKAILEIQEFSLIHNPTMSLHSKLSPQLKSFERLKIFEPKYQDTSLTASAQESDYVYEPYATFYFDDYGAIELGKNSTSLRLQPNAVPLFTAVAAEDIVEGDSILLMEEDFKFLASELLSEASNRFLANGEIVTRQYLDSALTELQNLGQTNRTQKSKALYEKMTELNAAVASEISINMVNRWIKGIEDQAEHREHGLETQSAQEKEHFLLFAKSLLIDRSHAEFFWDYGITQYRKGKVLEGKHVASLARSFLCGAVNANSLGLDSNAEAELTSLALQSTHVVTFIEADETTPPINQEL
ncbi:MAG: hypothetical protein AAF541_06790 [Pseudomonadota bacterium]